MSTKALSLISLLGLTISALLFPVSPAFATTPSTAPTNIVVTPGPGTLTVTWAAPTYLNGGTITAYSIDTSTTGNGAWSNVTSSISGTTYSYTINSLTPATNYYVRMSAIGTGGTSSYGYPWTKIYSTSTAIRDGSNAIVYDTGYGTGGLDTATVLANSPFSRVKYRLQYVASSTTNYAEADMAKWDTSTLTNANAPGGIETSVNATIANLRVPSLDSAANEFNVHTNVSDLNVVSSSSNLNVSGKQGRLEIWPWNYSQGTSLAPNGSPSTYDFDDVCNFNGAYGSFQVHDVTDATTILAWNDHGATSPDVGVGNGSAYGSANPDWTFAATANGWSNFNLQVYVNIPVAPLALLTTSVSLSAPASSSFRTLTTLTANTSTSGKVTFYAFGKRIPGCINVVTSANVATCNWKPSVHGQIPLSASFVPNTGLNSSTQLSKVVTTTKRLNAR